MEKEKKKTEKPDSEILSKKELKKLKKEEKKKNQSTRDSSLRPIPENQQTISTIPTTPLPPSKEPSSARLSPAAKRKRGFSLIFKKKSQKSILDDYVVVPPNEQEEIEMRIATDSILTQQTVNHVKEAAKIFKKLSDKGILDATWKIAACFIKGIGVDKNLIIGKKYAEAAMSKGSVDALFWFGLASENYNLLKQAADQDYLAALWWVGCYLFEGKGIEQDKYEGQKAMLKAASSGDIYWGRLHFYLCENNLYEFGRDDKQKSKYRKTLGRPPFDSDCSVFKPGPDA